MEGKIWSAQGDKRLQLTGPQDLDNYEPVDAPGENSTHRRTTVAKRLASSSPDSRPDTKRVNVFEQLAANEPCP
ncbi:Hypp6938 [Branchiostoma lanceolatum]|uniref:Hypp6938 protein n=1 Tax=Branchiostoma lanceolatum TaxID=7740 RepID=A0A8J9YW03_BRALA|nr:Hypp6938 [Branchiostoma lanceolatum]